MKRRCERTRKTAAAMKRLLSIVLAVLTIVSCLPLSALATQTEGKSSNPFKDVTSSDWYFEAVDYVYQNKIFNGKSESKFSPSDGMTRGMFVTALGRFAGVDASAYSGDGGFSDVDSGEYYAPYVSWAVEEGIVVGIGNGLFGTNLLVTREQMAVFIDRFMTVYGGSFSSNNDDKTPPRDLSSVSSWAVDSVLKLWKAGVINGDENRNFNPGVTATRAEAAAIYMNLGRGSDGMGLVQKDSEKPSNPVESNTWTISFDTLGGPAVDPLRVQKGGTAGELPQPMREGYVFIDWYTDKDLTEEFDVTTKINSNITLYAYYIETGATATQQKYDQTLQVPEIVKDEPVGKAFTVDIKTSSSMTVEQVKAGLSLSTTSGADDRDFVVTGSGQTFKVSMPEGWTPGVSYRLELADSALSFSDDDTETAGLYYFTVDRAESKALALNDIIYIPANDVSGIKVDGKGVESLSVGIYNFDASGNEITDELKGSFTYNGNEDLEVGDLLCVYDGLSPKDSDMEKTLYNNIAYIKVTKVAGKAVEFTNTDPEEVLDVAKTALVKKSDVQGYAESGNPVESFSFKSTTDQFESFMVGDDEAVVRALEIGDTLALYDGVDLLSISDADKIVMGRVTGITENSGVFTITCDVVTAEELEKSVNYHQVTQLDSQYLMDKGYIDEELLAKTMAQQAKESGMIDELASQYALLALETDLLEGDISSMEGLAVLMDDGSLADAEQLRGNMEDTVQTLGVEIGDPEVKAEIKKGGGEYGAGALVATLSVEFEIKIENANKDSIVITFGITFTQEVYLGVGADAGISWYKIWGIPVWPKDVWISAYLDTKTCSAVELSATANTKLKEPEKIKDPDTGKEIEVKEKKLDIASKINEIIDSGDEKESYDGVSGIYKTYQDFMATDWTYVELVRTSLLQVPITLAAGLVKMDVAVDFVLSGALNVSLSCDLKYMDGIRYSLNVSLSGPTVSFTQAQIVDRKLSFDASFVGRFGLKAGIELSLKVGLLSTKLNSVGATVQVGLYLEWMGFFCYEFERNFSTNTSYSDAKGAMYSEIGVYLDANAEAQAGDGKWKISIDLLSMQFPLLSTESKDFVYGFSLKLDEGEKLIINDTSNSIPSNTFKMIKLDMKDGKSYLQEYGKDKFKISFSDRRFSLSADNKIIVDAGDKEYLTATMVIVCENSTLAFTKSPVTLKIPIVYTKHGELVEKGLLTVVDQGGALIWEERVAYGKDIAEALPSQEKILDILGYSNFNAEVGGGIVNLKYDGTGGYTTTPSGKVDGDYKFQYTINKQVYTVKVEGIENLDGTTYYDTFTAEYGKSFDFSSLKSTYTEKPGEKYTVFSKVQSQKNDVADGVSIQDSLTNELALQLLNDTHTYRALYDDDSVTVNYDFVTTFGPGIEKRSEMIRKGSKTSFDFQTYVNDTDTYVVSEVDFACGTTVSASKTVKVVCKSKNEFMLEFKLNGGSFVSTYTPPNFYHPTTGTALPTAENVRQDGKIFIGWFLEDNFSGDPVETAKGDNGAMTFFAMWREPEYTIVFDSNGGSESMASIDAEHGVSTTLTENGFIAPQDEYLDGGVFTGWNTKPDGTGESYDDKDTITTPKVDKNGKVTLYAQWSKSLQVEYIVGDNEPVKMSMTQALAQGNVGTIRLLEDSVLKQGISLPNGVVFDGGRTASKDITLTTSGSFTMFTVAEGATAEIQNLIVSNPTGWVTENSGILRVTDVCVTAGEMTDVFRNKATGRMSMNYVSVSGGRAAVSNSGTIVIDNCSFSGAKPTSVSKSVINSFTDGVILPVAIINNTTIVNCTRTDGDTDSVAVYGFVSDIYILNSTIAGNVGPWAVFAMNTGSLENDLIIANSIVASNLMQDVTLSPINGVFLSTKKYNIYNSFIPSANTSMITDNIDNSFGYVEGVPADGKSIFISKLGEVGGKTVGTLSAGEGIRSHLLTPKFVTKPTELTSLTPTPVYLDYSDLNNIRLGYWSSQYDTIEKLIGEPTEDDLVTEYLGGGARASGNNRIGASDF